MIETNMRNEIVNKIRDLLDEGFEDIMIEVRETGFSIIPKKTFVNSTIPAPKEGDIKPCPTCERSYVTWVCLGEPEGDFYSCEQCNGEFDENLKDINRDAQDTLCECEEPVHGGYDYCVKCNKKFGVEDTQDVIKPSEHIIKLESDLWDQLEEYFPKGENKDRGKAMVLIAMAKEMGVKGHADNIKQRCSEDRKSERKSKLFPSKTVPGMLTDGQGGFYPDDRQSEPEDDDGFDAPGSEEFGGRR